MIIKAEKKTSASDNQAAPAATSTKTQEPAAQTGVATPPKLEPHPLSEIFPQLEGDAFAELVADISQNGVYGPITLLEGQILDGRNRYRAANEAGFECPTEEYVGNDPLGFVISKNLKRRHLNESQRAVAASKIANMRRGERTDLEPSANLPKVSQADAAKMVNVSERSVGSATKVKEKAVPELVAAVEAGKVSVAAAADVAALPESTQREALAKGPKAVKAAAKEVRLTKQKAGRKKPEQTDLMWAELHHLAGHCKDVTPSQFLAAIKLETRRRGAFDSAGQVNKWLEAMLQGRV